MWLILLSLCVGIIIGIIGVIPKKFMKFNSKFQQVGVVMLIFSMGASIGANEELIKNLKILGVKAITFALLACIFSITFTYLITTKFLKQNAEGTK